jgi:hypothetical protein
MDKLNFTTKLSGLTKPRFKHDCTECTYLGRHNGKDLYHCTQVGNPTIIVRHSNHPAEYVSGMVFARKAVEDCDFNNSFAQAYMRAKALNLI